jgi:hypothetical protein
MSRCVSTAPVSDGAAWAAGFGATISAIDYAGFNFDPNLSRKNFPTPHGTDAAFGRTGIVMVALPHVKINQLAEGDVVS